ncbi:MAG: TROVE domain-containing protein [Solobacterium sp.]|nr:TROVE domain-containing protein [Solobacterium sp.]
MARFNIRNTNRIMNADGYPAYPMQEKEELMAAVLTSMFGEEKFYGRTDGNIVRLAEIIAVRDPEFLAKLACYARNRANLRSVSHVLTAVIARHANAYTRIVIRNVVVRPDDITEIMACYRTMYGKPFPNAMKREIAIVMQKFNAYQFEKYDTGRDITFKDVLRIVHPVPANEQIEELFGRILDDALETPYTWETELSAKGNTKEVWNELGTSGKLGYMAALRNLRNILTAGADIRPVLEMLADAENVRRSRQLPFRFYAAYKSLLDAGLMTSEIREALEKALTASVGNMERIPGRTLIAVDTSGSMSCALSRRSDMRCIDIAALMGALAHHICDDAAVCYFSAPNSTDPLGYHIAHYGRYDSILEICRQTAAASGCTNMHLPLIYALQEDTASRPFDRIIYFSDNMCNSSYAGLKTVQSEADQYRQRFNRDLWVHGIDLQGYGTQQFCGKRFNLIAGWNEGILGFITRAENGFGDLMAEISNYEMK